MPFFHCFNGFH
ncbi:hypothetical protein D030_3812A, partial [Vibrio parahaemolyticus AQ3810]